MGLFDTVKNKFQEQQQASAEKKRAREEAERVAREQSQQEAERLTAEVLSATGENRFFGHCPADRLLSFTKDYYKKLVLPANSLSLSKLDMYPYTNEQSGKRSMGKLFAGYYSESETVVFVQKAGSGKAIALTDKYLYVSDNPVKDGVTLTYTVKIELDKVTDISVEADDEGLRFAVNGVILLKTAADKDLRRDIISLNYYLESIKKSDYEITDEEIDRLIHEKIGDKVYEDTKKYTTDDEKIIYFAWGLDSLTAKDYLLCTTKQFVMLDRELMGAVQNTKRFYYEDITSMSIQQDNGSGLTGMLLNAALKLCDMVIHVAGTQIKVSTLSVREAERVIEIYNGYKNEIRSAAKQPSVVVQQAAAEDPLTQLKKLNELKELGIVSEDEFNEKKAVLLAKL